MTEISFLLFIRRPLKQKTALAAYGSLYGETSATGAAFDVKAWVDGLNADDIIKKYGSKKEQ